MLDWVPGVGGGRRLEAWRAWMAASLQYASDVTAENKCRVSAALEAYAAVAWGVESGGATSSAPSDTWSLQGSEPESISGVGLVLPLLARRPRQLDSRHVLSYRPSSQRALFVECHWDPNDSTLYTDLYLDTDCFQRLVLVRELLAIFDAFRPDLSHEELASLTAEGDGLPDGLLVWVEEHGIRLNSPHSVFRDLRSSIEFKWNAAQRSVICQRLERPVEDLSEDFS